MMKTFLITLLLSISYPSNALGALSESDQALLGASKNYATNGGAENGKAGWTASGTSATAANLVIDTTNKYEGNAGFAWTPANADNFLTNSSFTITSNQGLSGKNCAAIGFFKSSDGLHALEVYDGTNVLASVTIPISTGFQVSTVNFPCSASSAIRIRINAGSTTILYADSMRWGDALGINLSSVAQASEYGFLRYPVTASCAWVSTNTSFANFSADTDCTTPSGSNLRGNATAPSTKIPGTTFTSLPPGNYYVVASFLNNYSAASVIEYRITDGTSFTAPWQSAVGTQNVRGMSISGSFSYTTAQSSLTFQIQGKVTGTDVEIDVSNTNYPFEITVYRFPTTSEQAYRPDATPASWSGYHATDCSFPRTNTAFGDPSADSTCTFTERTNRNFGTVTSYLSASDKLPGIVFTPPRVGRYYVCSQFAFTPNVISIFSGARLTDGTTAIAETGYDNTTANFRQNLSACGIYNVASIASTTIRLHTRSSSNTVNIETNTNNTALIEWSIFELDAALPAPLLVGSVTSNSSGIERIERAVLNCDGSSSITSQSGSWVSSIANISGSRCAVTLASGIFSASPTCTATAIGTSITDTYGVLINVTSSTAFSLGCVFNTGLVTTACTTGDFNVICMGQR